jgi:O-antigen/teichoic acid export membrane protein
MSVAEQVLGATVARRSRPSARRNLLRGGTLVVGSTLVWHGCNFAFNSVSARLLGPGGFSDLAAAVTLLYLASPLLTSVQTLTSRAVTSLEVAGERSRIRAVARRSCLRLAGAGAVVAVACSLASHPIARFLHLDSGWPIAIVGGGLCLSAVTHCQRGILQGLQRFERYAASTVVEASVKVAAVGVLVGWVSRSVDAAVAAVPVAAACALAANAALLRFLPRGEKEPKPIAARQSGTTATTFVFLALLLSVDVLAAKRYLPPHDAGLYAAVSLSGKVVYFATSALSFFLFPFFSERRDRDLDGRRQLAVGLVLIAACSAVLVAAYTAVPRFTVDLLFGGRFAGAAPYLGQIGIAFAGYALAYLAATFLLAQRSRLGAALLGAGVLLQVGALYVRHASVGQIVHVQVATLWATAVALGVAAFLCRTGPTPAVTCEGAT